MVIWSGRPANQATVMSREEGATVPLTSAISPDGSADGRRQRKLGVCTYLHRLRSMLGAKVGTRSVRCREQLTQPSQLARLPGCSEITHTQSTEAHRHSSTQHHAVIDHSTAQQPKSITTSTMYPCARHSVSLQSPVSPTPRAPTSGPVGSLATMQKHAPLPWQIMKEFVEAFFFDSSEFFTVVILGGLAQMSCPMASW